MDNLCKILGQHAHDLGIVWGWAEDPAAEYHRWVLYVVLPRHGQASFHTAARGEGPTFSSEWDGIRGKSAERILRFAADVLNGVPARKVRYYLATTTTTPGRPSGAPVFLKFQQSIHLRIVSIHCQRSRSRRHARMSTHGFRRRHLCALQ